MSSANERQAGTSGSAMGYEQSQATGESRASGQAQGQLTDQGGVPAQAQGREYQPAGRQYEAAGRHEATGRRGAIVGFTALAGTLMLLGGLWMVVVAIVALSHGHVFNTAPAYAFRYNIRGWGWTELSLGVVLFAIGMCVFLGMAWARYVGAFLAVLSAIANFVFIPYQPLWSLIMIAIDAFIIWALLTPRSYAREF
jgi:hypothetical protein